MKKIECIVRPELMAKLEEKLQSLVTGMTVTHVRGCGNQKGETQVYRGASLSFTLLPKIKIELMVKDDQVAKITEVIKTTCKTGEIGDGKIFIIPIEEAIRIRTGEKGEKAL